MTKLIQQFPFPVSRVPFPDVVEDSVTWVAEETATCDFQDARLWKRLRALLGQLANDVGASIPFACQDWTNTKAAYRFLSNESVNEAAILAGHFQSAAGRFASCSGPVLVLQDTTAFTYYRNNPKGIGEPYKAIVRNGVARKQTKSMCGILMHSSLAVTTQGVPLGLAAIKFSSRSRYQCPQAEGQSYPRADSKQRKHSLA
jgi:hypothetical protein